MIRTCTHALKKHSMVGQPIRSSDHHTSSPKGLDIHFLDSADALSASRALFRPLPCPAPLQNMYADSCRERLVSALGPMLLRLRAGDGLDSPLQEDEFLAAFRLQCDDILRVELQRVMEQLEAPDCAQHSGGECERGVCQTAEAECGQADVQLAGAVADACHEQSMDRSNSKLAHEVAESVLFHTESPGGVPPVPAAVAEPVQPANDDLEGFVEVSRSKQQKRMLQHQQQRQQQQQQQQHVARPAAAPSPVAKPAVRVAAPAPAPVASTVRPAVEAAPQPVSKDAATPACSARAETPTPQPKDGTAKDKVCTVVS